MIPTVAAVTVLIGFAIGVAVWGSFVGIMSAEKGPGWAQDHLRRAGRVFVVAAGTGAMAAALVEPVWFGLALAYIALVSIWITWRVRRTTEAAALLGDAEALPAERVATMLLKASRTLTIGGIVLIAIALVDFVWRSWPALIDLALAAALLVPAYAYRRRADRLSAELSVRT